MKELAKKLLEVQKEVGPVMKDANNPFFKSKYADINKFIEVVKPILNKHGIVVLQPLDILFGGPAPLLTTILIDAESGDEISFKTPLPPMNPDPQKQGSAITYFRRYALQSILFLQAEDDDANLASGKDEKGQGGAGAGRMKPSHGKPSTETEDLPF